MYIFRPPARALDPGGERVAERNGWFKFYRSDLSNPFITKDTDHLALWVFLLAEAAIEPTEAVLGGKKMVLQPGQLTTGRKQLSQKTGINEYKIERTLNCFENAHLIAQQKTNKNRLISILSWDERQQAAHQNAQQMHNKMHTLEEVSKNKEYREADEPPRSRFVPPTVDEVWQYCQEKNLKIDQEAFVDFYASKGWKVGQNPMKDWQAAVRNWERRNRGKAKQEASYEDII